MSVLTIIRWVITNWKIAAKAIYGLSIALLLIISTILYNNNKNLSAELEIAQNNIEAYQGALNGSQQAFNVLKLDMSSLSQQNDVLLQRIDSVRKDNKIKASKLKTAATQRQVVYVTKAKEVEGDILTILKDTTYTDSIQYNPLTKVHYSIGKDSVNMTIDLQNTQYLYLYTTREYKNKKSFFKRLFTFDWKKVNKYQAHIENTNDLLKEEDVRIVEQK